ncbi:unnamed protein product [Malus baccata var. baccata]
MNWSTNVFEIKEKSRLIDTLWAQEESFWHQRSRVKWLWERDANTKFFHQSTLQRRRRNMILKLKDGEDSWVENPTQIRKLVDNHFLNVFKSGGPRDWGNLLEGINTGVTDEMNMALMESVSLEEINVAALQMGGLKTPGLDGFQGIFYRSFWEIIVEDVNNLVRSLMQDVVSPTEITNTHIVLIPKIPNPESVSHFRPISLCNYSYKVLSKVLANRLKVILPHIISPSQNAFVAGRQIQDNIGIGHEATMEKLGFCRQWRKLIMGCVSPVKFAVILNGHSRNKFAPSRGLRQGDPLSPYLFLLIGEVLFRLIQVAVENKSLDGVKLGVTGPVLSHIFFADDMLIFFRANEKNCRNLVNLLRSFCDASGQEVNLQKSSVFFGTNTPVRVSEELGSILGMPIVDNPGTYLGVPTLWGRSKKQGLAYVKGRIVEKLQGWKNSTLSKAGKEVLIKAVVQAIPAYPMNIFKFPAMVLIKARYFPNCSFLDAKKEGRAFWAWSSLLMGRDLLINGTHWQIMGGQDVRVWVDRWLPFIPLERPSPLGEAMVTRNLHVSSLIFPQFRDWDIIFLLHFLSVPDQEAIEGTPIGDISRRDRLIWAATKNGRYTVKSGYRWLQSRSLSMRDHRLPLARSIPDKLWNCIWKVDVPPKIRNFLWNSMHNILATKANLYKSWFKMSCLGFVGVVLRDTEAHFIAAARYHIRALCAAVAEALALLRGCELGAALGFSEVILESDFSEAISCLSNSMENGSWEASPTLERVKLLGEDFQNCRWSWVPRSANMAADALMSRDSAELCDVV